MVGVYKKKYKYILGIQSYANHDTGACIIKFSENSKKKPEYIAISEERLLRIKYPYTFPIHSINYCLEYFNLKSISKIDLIVSDWIREKKWLRSGPSYNYQEFDYIKEKLNYNKNKIIQISHHLAHAASVYYTSGYNESSILICDGNGSNIETNSYFAAKKNKINLIDKYNYHGIGALYSAITKNILNLGTGAEGKVMGLAAYGKKNKKFKIPYKFDGIKTDFSKFMLRMPYSDVLNSNDNHRINPLRTKISKANPKNIMNKKFTDIAYEAQFLTEKTLIHLGNDLYIKNKSNNLCFAGGVALNCLANDKLIKKTKFKNLYVFPASSDAGLPMGLALWGYHNVFNQKTRITFENAYTGKTYNRLDIKNLLSKNKVQYENSSPKKIAQVISKGKIVGHFSGASEYGPRALGNRSILADARKRWVRNYINLKVKHREMYRPFAPATLEESASKFFYINKSPFMLRATKSKKEKIIPSAIHVDNTARVQTVNKKQNDKFYNIIKEFKYLTGVPVILNTSFNDAGEPLVETPLDAFICFLNTKIDYLVLENFLIKKENIKSPKKLAKFLQKKRKSQINLNEKKILQKITKNYSINEYKKKKKIENQKAIHMCLNLPYLRLKKIVRTIKKNDKVLIIGSQDHSYVLQKLFYKNLKKVINSIDFFDIKKKDVYSEKYKLMFNKVHKTNIDKYNKIIISTYQYFYELKDSLIFKGCNKLKTFYTNSSRSIIDYYYIKKYKGKNKIYSKSIK